MISETMISETMISRTRRTTAFGILVVAFAVNIATSGLTVAEDFVRGDVNGDGIASYADVVYNCQWQFLGLQVVTCLDAADVDDDGEAHILDRIALSDVLLLGNGPIAAPFPTPGADPTEDDIDCDSLPDGQLLIDEVASISVSGSTPGGDDRLARIVIQLSSSHRLGGYGGRLRDEAGVLDHVIESDPLWNGFAFDLTAGLDAKSPGIGVDPQFLQRYGAARRRTRVLQRLALHPGSLDTTGREHRRPRDMDLRQGGNGCR
jgi:hypothetical protein